jgi:Tol biopolymer transport system component
VGEFEGGQGSSQPQDAADRLDSWKKIAAFLKRDVSTVQRWERREGMPVHRHVHDKQGSVFAYRSELDSWWKSRQIQLTEKSAAEEPSSEPAPLQRNALPVAQHWRAMLVLTLVAGAVVWFLIERKAVWRNPLADAKFSRLSGSAGNAQAAAISPDGRFAAFLANHEGRVDAWLGEISSGAYRNLTDGALQSLVNPSIRTLGFSADSALVTVWNRKGDGTHPGDVSIAAAPTRGGPLRSYLPDVAEYEWSRDGKKLVYHTTAPGDPIFLRESGAQEGHQIYVAPAGVHCHYPVWSVDEDFIYFVRGVPPDDWDIWRIRTSGKNLERVTQHNGRVSYPVMLDRRTLAYLVNEADGSGPWIYGLDIGHPIPHRLTSGLETYTSLAGSADGMRLIATTVNPRSSLWRIQLNAKNATADPPIALEANAFAPRLGPNLIAFISTRNGSPGLWTMTQGVAHEIWRKPNFRIFSAPAISPDGTRIALAVDDGNRKHLLVTDKDGSNAAFLTDDLELRGNPAWAPDGKSIVSAVDHAGEPRLTRIFLNGEPPVTLLGEYSVDPIWSADGGFVIYSGRDIGTTFPVRAAAADGRPYEIPGLLLTRGARRLVLTKDASALLILRGDIGHKDIWWVDLRSGNQRQLTSLPPDFLVNDFDLSADGSELILDKVENTSDLALIERSKVTS